MLVYVIASECCSVLVLAIPWVVYRERVARVELGNGLWPAIDKESVPMIVLQDCVPLDGGARGPDLPRILLE